LFNARLLYARFFNSYLFHVPRGWYRLRRHGVLLALRFRLGFALHF